MTEEAPALVQARLELLTKFKAALKNWHRQTEELDDENLTFAAVQGPLPPSPKIEREVATTGLGRERSTGRRRPGARSPASTGFEGPRASPLPPP
jgi:hypothetical protein